MVPKRHQRMVVVVAAVMHFLLRLLLRQMLPSRNASKEEEKSRVGLSSTRGVVLVWAFARRLRTRAIGLEKA